MRTYAPAIVLIIICALTVNARDCLPNEVPSASNLCIPPIGESGPVGKKTDSNALDNQERNQLIAKIENEEYSLKLLKSRIDNLQTQLKTYNEIYDSIQTTWENCLYAPDGILNGKPCTYYEKEKTKAYEPVLQKEKEISDTKTEINDIQFKIDKYKKELDKKTGTTTPRKTEISTPKDIDKPVTLPRRKTYLAPEFMNFKPLELSEYQKKLLADSKEYQSFSDLLEQAAIKANPRLSRLQSLPQQTRTSSPFLSNINKNLDSELETKGIPNENKAAYKGLAKKSKALGLSQKLLEGLSTDNPNFNNLWGYDGK